MSDIKLEYERLQKLYHCFRKTRALGERMGGWMDGLAGLRIAYSNQKSFLSKVALRKLDSLEIFELIFKWY